MKNTNKKQEELKHLEKFKNKLEDKNFNLIKDLIRDNYFIDLFDLENYIRGAL